MFGTNPGLWHSALMPLFARRQLRLMLDELSAHFDVAKTNDLLNRLENVETNIALAAEAELSVIWAISQVAHLTIEPTLANSTRRPDASSDNLFASAGAIIEIRALSDDNFSGKEAMDRTANIISGYADRIKKRFGQHLYFEFSERSYWEKSHGGNRYYRERCTDPDFELTPGIKRSLMQWITASNWPSLDRLRITEGKTDVVISWREVVSQHFRVFSQMPPLAYDLEDNPIYKALKKKARQVKGASPDKLRCVFLFDAGCDLLRRLQPMSAALEIGGETIIRHAIKKLSIDVVCVFSPQRQGQIGFSSRSRLVWGVTFMDNRKDVPIGEYDRLNELVKKLPLPRFEGYQARSLHRQGSFDPQRRGWYLATTIGISEAGTKMTIKISSRLVLEYLAGRIDIEKFQHHTSEKDKNFFDIGLTQGRTIQDVKFESAGPNEDDDYLIFQMGYDLAASPLKRPQEPQSDGS